MTHIATMGTSSCATIAIGGFKDNNRDLNEAYIKDPKSFVESKEGLTVSQFSHQILYPTSQPLGKTKEYPFEKLMSDLASSNMASKFVMATLNEWQYRGNDNYWHKQLKKHGFKLFAKTSNNWGSINYLYLRNPSEVKISDEELKTA